MSRRSADLRAAVVAAAWLASSGATAAEGTGKCEFSDSHFHLTNYIQEGPSPAEILKLTAGRVCRSTLFGIPLQQQWAYHETGDFAPTYYLEADAPLYYYSFVDAAIAMAYKALPAKDQAHFDPMITGFN